MKSFRVMLFLFCYAFLCLGSAFGFSTHNTSVSRTFDKTQAPPGDSITVKMEFTNLELNGLRGLYYSEQIPEGIQVTTTSVKIDETTVLNYAFELGTVSDVYPGHFPTRWILETPPSFGENNPVSHNAKVEIVYTISSSQEGTFFLDEFNWVGYYQTAPEGQTAAFGHSEDIDKQKLVFISENQPPVAHFSANPTTGVAPLSVSFTDFSTGDVTSWSWDFDNDDDEDSTQQNPYHTYIDSGTYTVRLRVTGPSATDTETKINYITVFAPVQHSLRVNTVGSGTVELDPEGGTYDEGTGVRLTATADPGWVFNSWSGDLSGSENPTTLTMNADKSVTVTFLEDHDGDGVSDAEEDGGPNGGDGNEDGVPDSLQANVSCLLTYDGQQYIVLWSLPGTTIRDCEAVDNPSPADAPSGIDFPYGFFKFMITGLNTADATTLTLKLPAGASPPTTYYKYGPTPSDATDKWYEFMYDAQTQTGAEINDKVITLHFVDGLRGDDDRTANGVVVEPGGPAAIIDGGTAGSGDGGGGGGGGCFIATAAYGSSVNRHAMVLHECRDCFLLTNAAGKTFVRLCNRCLPPVANFLAAHEMLRFVVGWSLLPCSLCPMPFVYSNPQLNPTQRKSVCWFK